jgi:hypothetical protein
MSGGASSSGPRWPVTGVLVIRLWCDEDDPEPRARITARLDLTDRVGQEATTVHGSEAIVRAVADRLARFAAGPASD